MQFLNDMESQRIFVDAVILLLRVQNGAISRILELKSEDKTPAQ